MDAKHQLQFEQLPSGKHFLLVQVQGVDDSQDMIELITIYSAIGMNL